MKNMTDRQLFLLRVFMLFEFSCFLCILSQNINYSATFQCMANTCLRANITLCKSRIECAVKCSTNSTCVGFVYYGTGNCVHLQNGCLFNTICGNSDIPEKVYEKLKSYCKNSGQWDSWAQKCSCSNGWVGARCERRAYKCSELREWGYSFGWYIVTIDVYRNQTRLVYTHCEISQWVNNTLIFVSDASLSHNKTWKEYVAGYEENEHDSWLGLDNALAFNQMGQMNVSVLLVAQHTNNFVWEFRYTKFHMDDASAGYSFTCDFILNTTYNTYTMSNRYYLQDVLKLSKGNPFSTWDRDQDRDLNNCASLYGAGWWIGLCPPNQYLNPLGRNKKSTIATIDQIWLPGINFNDLELAGEFQSFLMVFTD